MKCVQLNQSGQIIGVCVWPETAAPSCWEALTEAQAQSLPEEFVGWSLVNGVLVAPASPTASQLLASAQTAQSALLAGGCATSIVSGFTSSALGSANTYPSDPTTQGNIDRAAVHGGAIWCESSAGAWSLAQHTAAQALQVQADLWTHIQNCQSKLATLKAQVAAATTVSAVEAVVWS